MKNLEQIRGLYTPIQPTIKRSNNKVTYSEFLPHPELQSFVYCYWELKTNEELDSPFVYRVVTDGCIDIFFNLANSEENFVMGFCKKYTEFPLENSFQYVGVRFLPTMFPQIFGINASLMSNKFQLLKEIAPDTSAFLASNFKESIDQKEIQSKLDDYFLSVININDFNDDHRFYNAIDLILKNFGVINLEQELNTGISQRQLRRLFKYYIGSTPKSFSKVVRFQNILRAKPSTQSLKRNKLFYDLGYYDQAHFIKDFKSFYGVTPTKAFGRD